MDPRVRHDLERSRRAFVCHAWPRIQPILEAERLEHVEGARGLDAGLATLLDMGGGVDAYAVSSRTGVRAIASRVQFGYKNFFQTFTIRWRRHSGAITEAEKTFRALRNDSTRAHLHVHTYVTDDGGTFCALAMVPTVSLFRSLGGEGRDNYTHDRPQAPWQLRETDNAEFVFARWVDLLEVGVPVTIINFTTDTADAFTRSADPSRHAKNP